MQASIKSSSSLLGTKSKSLNPNCSISIKGEDWRGFLLESYVQNNHLANFGASILQR